MIVSHDVDGPADAPAVVLLHSSVGDRRMWEPQWRPLAQAGFLVVRADFRGCGRTPVATAPYSDEADVVGLLDALGLADAAFVGSSYGGRVALRVAALHPQRVTALALLCAGRPGHAPGPALRAFGEAEDALLDAGDLDAAAALNARTWLGPEADEETRGRVTRMQRENFAHWFAAHPAGEEADHELPEPALDLRAVTAPTLAVGGAHDLPDFRRIAAELPGLLPRARHRELPWAGHLPSLERPAEITALLLDFLGEERDRGASTDRTTGP
ncbi:alpha/beta fold hydrolase [Streptomyces sp. AN091965]|uniref:alpha/beta fold hydrolase n=1 Tax=Streptomyces sp. AN091965 TaxID=2927803 RepID=UPI001F614E84|nr:alpha/beta fold hydrolase [Streptomyces sp. AN091965]MCI3928920.1 alpha/beta hydrolase [Streptomyces sp. AN091965]